jgi:hypothetical protein
MFRVATESGSRRLADEEIEHDDNRDYGENRE